MVTAYHVANAPCSWGVDFADRPENPPWRQVLDEVAAAGFAAVDLGPVGFFPTDPAELRDELGGRGLSLSAGGLFDPLADPTAFPGIVDKTRRTCEVLRALDAPRLVIIDCVTPERGRTAGRGGAARRLDPAEWHRMMARIAELARMARDDYGVRSYLHAHAGTFVEFEDELDRAMGDLPAELVGLCVDTGHAAYAGSNPIALIHRYSDRIGHMHFKNVKESVRRDCIEGGIDFFEAIARGIFCPLGDGMVDFVEVKQALDEIGFVGMAVVEQDVDPAGDASPLVNARESHAFLRSIGIVPKNAIRA